MLYLTILFLSFLITVITTPYLINFLTKNDLLDKPTGEKRRMHTEPVPRMGGIIIFIVVILITSVFYQDIYSRKFFITGAFIVFGLGLLDDIKGVNWQIKFFVQAVAVIFLILSFNSHNFEVVKLLGYTLPNGFNYLFVFILILGILNSFNLMDGLDGLVLGFSLILATMCFLITIGKPFTFLPYLSSAIIGTTLGLLKFNANPARIFLGDSGSLVLGYFSIALVFSISGNVFFSNGLNTKYSSNTIDLTFVIIAFAIPITDTLRVIFVRLKGHRNPFLPDTNHLHHILYSNKIRHKTVVLLIHLFSIVFVLLALYYMFISKITALILLFLFVIILLNTQRIIGFILRKNNLLAYGRLYKKVPAKLSVIYKKVLLPIISVFLFLLFAFLIINEVKESQPVYVYFLFFLIPFLLYSGKNIKMNNYYAELLVFINIIMFFIITGLNGFFYKPYAFPAVGHININQIFILTLSGMIIFFVLFKERIANIREQFLTGADLTIAVLILFIYIAVQLINLPASYKISDTLLRSYLVFLLYKIVVVIKPRIHFSLYFISFLAAIIAVLKSLF